MSSHKINVLVLRHKDHGIIKAFGIEDHDTEIELVYNEFGDLTEDDLAVLEGWGTLTKDIAYKAVMEGKRFSLGTQEAWHYPTLGKYAVEIKEVELGIV